jgi:PRC-barrel domain
MTTLTDAQTWKDRNVVGTDGDKIGRIKEIYEDGQTGRPEWALVSSGLLGCARTSSPSPSVARRRMRR